MKDYFFKENSRFFLGIYGIIPLYEVKNAMEYKVEELSFPSTNGKDEVYAKILSPIDSSKIKGIIQFCHGMCEYFDKYMEFFKYMLENGYVVCGHDMIGHGKTAKYDSDKGFFAEKDGYKYMIADTKTMTDLVRERFPYPMLFLMGHSMGSLVARNYAAKFGKDLNGLLLCGTVGPQPLIDSAIRLSNFIIRKKGERYRSRVLYQTFNDFACIGFKGESKLAWTTSDEEQLKETIMDDKQNFIFTASGFRDLFKLVKYANAEKTIETIPKSLPVLLFSGEEDPVGERKLGVNRVARLLKHAKLKNVTVKLYPKCRHEMLREVNRKQVFREVLDWVEQIRFGEEI